MCGIVGQINTSAPVQSNTFEYMCYSLAHRGPDAAGIQYFENCHVALGHRRLSIIDLSDAGHQPMTNEDGTIWVTFNGEIYNFMSLRKILQQKGHNFRSSTDTEVIIHAYEEWGVNCIKQFRGIFAFGVWDAPKSSLLLARDHLGIKPLHYFFNGNCFIFASEIKAILANSSVSRTLRLEALSDYLAYGYVPFNRSIFNDIWKLPAGHYLYFSKGKIQIEQYWKVEYTGEITEEEEAVALLNKTLEETIQLQLMSDVPIGVFLSGGVDSSAVAAIMSSHYNKNIHSFTIGFEQDEYDETPYARKVASFLNTDHHEQLLSYDLAKQILFSFPSIYDEPFYDSSGIPTYLVSQLARSYLKVVLAGDGGDEIFAGYRWYDRFTELVGQSSTPPISQAIASMMWPPLRRAKRYLPYLSNIENLVGQRARHPMATYFNEIGFLDHAAQKKILHPNVISQIPIDTLWLFKQFWREEYPQITKVQYLDINTYLVDDILTKVDRASMAHGLEVRVPLLDYKLVEFSFKVSHKLHYANRERKALFKRTISGRLPQEILSARKKGFSVPIKTWMTQGLKENAIQLLKDGSLVNRSIFNTTMVENFLLHAHPKYTWLLFELELWARHWLEGEAVNEESIKTTP